MGNLSPSFSFQINPPGRRARRAACQCRACILNSLFFLTAFSITAHQRCDYCDSIRRGSTAGGNILCLITARLSLICCQKPPRSPSCEVESSSGKWREIKREGGRLRWIADWMAGWMAVFEGLHSTHWRTHAWQIRRQLISSEACEWVFSFHTMLPSNQRGNKSAKRGREEEKEGGGRGEVVMCYNAGSHTSTHTCTRFHASSVGNSKSLIFRPIFPKVNIWIVSHSFCTTSHVVPTHAIRVQRRSGGSNYQREAFVASADEWP